MLGVTVAIGVGVCKPWEPGRRGTGMGGQEEARLQLFCRETPPTMAAKRRSAPRTRGARQEGSRTVADHADRPGLVAGSRFIVGPLAVGQRRLLALALVKHLAGQRVAEGELPEGLPAAQRAAQHARLQLVPGAVAHRAPCAAEEDFDPAGATVPAPGEPPLLVLCRQRTELGMRCLHPA